MGLGLDLEGVCVFVLKFLFFRVLFISVEVFVFVLFVVLEFIGFF